MRPVIRHLHSPSTHLLSVREPLAHQSLPPPPSSTSALSRPSGQSSIIVGNKGCTSGGTQDGRTVSIHSGPPGVLVASYAHFCSSNRCNRARSTSVLLNSLPRPAAPAPGDVQCPICVQPFGPCPENAENVTCPKGTTHCYSGYIRLYGGGFYSKINIQGCMTEASSSLLNHTRKIGIFSVAENSDEPLDPIFQDRAVPTPLLGWVVGLGLFLLSPLHGGVCPM
uniref:UPAR/Ly6 domain-containing protein n=1 Tax=Suricata suricatta TaxID=37032 RepID=A0A673USR4_SURSU